MSFKKQKKYKNVNLSSLTPIFCDPNLLTSIDEVTKALQAVKDAGGRTEDAIDVLNDIRKKLLRGQLKVQK